MSASRSCRLGSVGLLSLLALALTLLASSSRPAAVAVPLARSPGASAAPVSARPWMPVCSTRPGQAASVGADERAAPPRDPLPEVTSAQDPPLLSCPHAARSWLVHARAASTRWQVASAEMPFAWRGGIRGALEPPLVALRC